MNLETIKVFTCLLLSSMMRWCDEVFHPPVLLTKNTVKKFSQIPLHSSIDLHTSTSICHVFMFSLSILLQNKRILRRESWSKGNITEHKKAHTNELYEELFGRSFPEFNLIKSNDSEIKIIDMNIIGVVRNSS